MAVTPHNCRLLFDRRERALRETGILHPLTGRVDKARIFACDECPNPIDSFSRGNNVSRLFCKAAALHGSLMIADVRNPAGPTRRPNVIGNEHPEQVTVDPIISYDGRVWLTQVIMTGKTLTASMVPPAKLSKSVAVSATENVSVMRADRSLTHRAGRTRRHSWHG
jgi:hypothetical protein